MGESMATQLTALQLILLVLELATVRILYTIFVGG